MFGLLFSWFIGKRVPKISCTKIQTLLNLRLPISSGGELVTAGRQRADTPHSALPSLPEISVGLAVHKYWPTLLEAVPSLLLCLSAFLANSAGRSGYSYDFAKWGNVRTRRLWFGIASRTYFFPTKKQPNLWRIQGSLTREGSLFSNLFVPVKSAATTCKSMGKSMSPLSASLSWPYFCQLTFW